MSEFRNYRIISKNIHASGLPRAKDIFWLQKKYKLQIVYDLTKRERSHILNICNKLGIKYEKIGINENSPDKQQIINLIETLNRNKDKVILIFCYRGIHRTGIILKLFYNIPIDESKFKNHKKLLECQNLNPSVSVHICKAE